MASHLKAPESDLSHQVADVQRIGGRVEPHIDPDRTRVETGLQELEVGRVVNQAAGTEIVDEVHMPP